MDELPNTHYIASCFEVTKSGRELILSQFHEFHPDIFAGYETAINAQIKLFQSGKVGNAPQSPKMLPLKHTIYERKADSVPSTTRLSTLGINTLIDLDEDSEESSSESSLSEDFSTYWIPKAGNIDILQREFANAIADQTGCIFCPEPEYKRIRLISGNTQAALVRLQRIEPLLALLARHGSGPVQKVDHNLLSFSCESKGTAVRYVSTMQQEHAERIMVDAKLAEKIESMLVGEEQLYNEVTGKYSMPNNLQFNYIKQELAAPSKMWASHEMKGIGNPQNAIPHSSSGGISIVSSIGPFRPNENMGLLEQARVREWSKNIDVRADPTQPVSSPTLSEPGVEAPTSVRVLAKSDSDDEEEVEEATYRVVAQDSDDEDDPTPAPMHDRTPRLAEGPETSTATEDGQTARNRRGNRANRYQNAVSTQIFAPLARPATGLVSAASLFADVPRDKDALGEARFQTTSAKQHTTSAEVTKAQSHTSQNRLSKRFGYDGAADEIDEEQPRALVAGRHETHAGVAHSTTTQARSLSPETMDQYKPGPGFNPENYGVNAQGGRRQPRRRYATQTNTFTSSTHQPEPTSTWLRAPPATQIDPAQRRRNRPQNSLQRIQDQLVDLSDEEDGRAIGMRPPLGLSPASKVNDFGIVQAMRPLDAPLENIQQPSIKPAWDDVLIPLQDGTSVSTSISSGHRPLPLDYNIQTKVNKPDIGYIRNDMVSQLKALQTKRKPKKAIEVIAQQSSERIDPMDEISTRKFYSTMNLKAPNPGKGKKGKGVPSNLPAGETRAQRDARIAQAKAELGLTPVPVRKPQPLPQQMAPQKLSKKAEQVAMSNPRMARLHADSLQDISRKRIAREITGRMRIPFDVACTFPGDVEFEFQIGQLLVGPTTRIKTNGAMESERWKTVFDNGPNSAEVFFTNLLTSSGADADGILEAKAEGTKVWNKDQPGRHAIVLEFECQDSSGSEFTLHLNLDGTHATSKDSFVLQQVGVQCPGHTWDTCTVLKGRPIWHDVPGELRSSIAELIDSVHVRPGPNVDVFFKIPSNNTLIVREVIVKRTSKHDSQLVDECDLQLKIVESKTLYMTGHKKDRRLLRCTEKGQVGMSKEDRVHYEVTLVDRAINTSFHENKTLQAGDTISTKPLLSFDRVLGLVRAALRLVGKIDWVGGHNIGTIVQRQYADFRKEEEAARSILPSMLQQNFVRPVHQPTGMTVAGNRSVVGSRTMIGSAVNGIGPVSVHGIRSGTSAQMVTDAAGNFFRIGLGGARIPLGVQRESSLAGDGVVPDDSASQVGAARRRPMRRIAERPEGFW